MENTVHIITLDVGTTTVRCHLINQKAETVHQVQDQVHLLYPKPGHVEIDPKVLWNQISALMRKLITESQVSPTSIKAMGISAQRGSVITWRKDTGEYLHNFITWKDMRADGLVREWNNAFIIKTMKAAAYCLWLVTRNRRYLAGSTLKFTNSQTTMRLSWALQNIPELKKAVKEKQAMCGTLDTWLLYKLTQGRSWVTDITNASATGFFDPFILQRLGWLMSLCKIPEEILPPIVDNNFEFGSLDNSIIGFEVPIKCLMADQSASMFGSYCFEKGDMKITLGTGGFLNVNTGSLPHGSVGGLYPVVGWKLGKEISYMTEGACLDTGSLIEWALKAELCATPEETSNLAQEVQSNDGVYFVPAFSGLTAPSSDMKAATTFIGIKPTTTKAHLMRAILESIGYRIYSLYKILHEETDGVTYKKTNIDGGVSKNNFVCQLIADLTGLRVERLASTEMSILGVAFVAGLNIGVWKSKEALKQLRIVDQEFNSELSNYTKYREVIKQWTEAVNRCRKWY